MLGLAKRTGSRIMQASTSEIYGDQRYTHRVSPIKAGIDGPRACCDERKGVLKLFFGITKDSTKLMLDC